MCDAAGGGADADGVEYFASSCFCFAPAAVQSMGGLSLLGGLLTCDESPLCI